MASSSVLRRGSRFMFPVAIRTVKSRRILHGAVSGELGRQSVPILQFSTAADDHDATLVRQLESKICWAERIRHLHFPDGFPFEIEHKSGDTRIFLKTTYRDEIINVEVDRDQIDSRSGKMIVTISKGGCETLEFRISAGYNWKWINALSIRNSEYTEDQLLGPKFDRLDDNLCRAFYEYLRARGICPMTIYGFLYEYIRAKKDHNFHYNNAKDPNVRKHLPWLRAVKGFMEK